MKQTIRHHFKSMKPILEYTDQTLLLFSIIHEKVMYSRVFRVHKEFTVSESTLENQLQ